MLYTRDRLKSTELMHLHAWTWPPSGENTRHLSLLTMYNYFSFLPKPEKIYMIWSDKTTYQVDLLMIIISIIINFIKTWLTALSNQVNKTYYTVVCINEDDTKRSRNMYIYIKHRNYNLIKWELNFRLENLFERGWENMIHAHTEVKGVWSI